jgi:parallel beta-helix repeat protein
LEALEDRTLLSASLSVNQLDLVVPGGNTAVNSGTWSGSNVTLSASAGTLVQNSNGTWSWSEATPGNVKAQSQTVTLTATDNQGNTSQASFFVNSGNILTVTTTNDEIDGGTAANPAGPDGALSLREAIAAANAEGGAVIAFQIPGTGPFTIQPQSALDPINVPVVIDGYSQPGATPNTLAVGDNAVLKIDLDGSKAGLVNGLNIGSNSTVEGLAVTNFGNGQPGFTAPVAISTGGNNQIIGDFIGMDVTGTVAEGNGMGVVAYGTGNTIGGTAPVARNVIGGNADFGVWLRNNGNVVEGNYLGTDHTGTKAFGNTVGVQDDWSNTIGGSASGAGNVISGNGLDGIRTGNTASDEIQGNFIGTDATGKVGLGNGLAPPPGVAPGDGIEIDLGSATITGNVISANPYGITSNGYIAVQGNKIGTDATGTTTTGTDGKSLGNTITGIVANAPAKIDGTTAAGRNVISGNGTGIAAAPGVVIQGNYIGTDITGTHALGNAVGTVGDAGGIEFSGGGVTVVGNLISGNGAGIDIRGGSAGGREDGSGTVIQGNLIGTDYTGTQPLGNAVGIYFQSGGSNYTIGGLTPGAGNVISGNGRGISMVNDGTPVSTGDVIEGNFIGTNTTGATNLGNGTGVYIEGYYSGTKIGGTTATAANVIADNGGDGIYLNGSNGNVIQGNSIIKNGANGVDLILAFNNMVGGTVSGAGNTIASNGAAGIAVGHDGFVPASAGNSFLENSIHDNGGLGIYLNSATHANDDQAAPVLTSASSSSSGTTVSGTLNSVASTTFRVEFFANTTGFFSGTGYYGQGRTFLGYVNVTTDATGYAPISFTLTSPLPAGQTVLSTTATKLVGTSLTPNDTSQFSRDVSIPSVGPITAPLAPVAINTTINASASFTDAIASYTHTAVWNWGDSTTSSGTVSESNGAGTVTGSHAYSVDGVYTVTLTVTNNGGGSAQSVFNYVVVFNPSAGFVTGGGWFNSPAGAYAANPTLTGQANVGLNAKYKSGSTVPSGNTEFQFPAANLNFHATSYDWLVINGNQAQYQGSGTINGAGNYGFLVTAQDNGGTTPDLLRLKIWDKNNNNAVVYDTQPGAATTAAPTTPLGGGRIQIHTQGPNPSMLRATNGSPSSPTVVTDSVFANPAPAPAASPSDAASNATGWSAFEAILLGIIERDIMQWEDAMMKELATQTQALDQLFVELSADIRAAESTVAPLA